MYILSRLEQHTHIRTLRIPSSLYLLFTFSGGNGSEVEIWNLQLRLKEGALDSGPFSKAEIIVILRKWVWNLR